MTTPNTNTTQCPPFYADDTFLNYPLPTDEKCTLSISAYEVVAACLTVMRLAILIQLLVIQNHSSSRSKTRSSTHQRRFPLIATLQATSSLILIALCVSWPHASAPQGITVVLFGLWATFMLPGVGAQAIGIHHFASKIKVVNSRTKIAAHRSGSVRSDPIMMLFLTLGTIGVFGLLVSSIALTATQDRRYYVSSLVCMVPGSGFALALVQAVFLVVRELRAQSKAIAHGRNGEGALDASSNAQGSDSTPQQSSDSSNTDARQSQASHKKKPSTLGFELRLTVVSVFCIGTTIVSSLLASGAVLFTVPIAFTFLFFLTAAEIVFLSLRLKGRQKAKEPAHVRPDGNKSHPNPRKTKHSAKTSRKTTNPSDLGQDQEKEAITVNNGSVYVPKNADAFANGIATVPKIDIAHHDTLAARTLTYTKALKLANFIGSPFVSSLLFVCFDVCVVVMGASLMGILEAQAGVIAGSLNLFFVLLIVSTVISISVIRLLLANGTVLLRMALLLVLMLCLADVIFWDVRIVTIFSIIINTYLALFSDAFTGNGELLKPTLATVGVVVLVAIFALLQFDLIINRRATVVRAGFVGNNVVYSFNTYQAAKDASFALILVTTLDLVVTARNFMRKGQTNRNSFLLHVSAPIRVRVKLLNDDDDNEAGKLNMDASQIVPSNTNTNTITTASASTGNDSKRNSSRLPATWIRDQTRQAISSWNNAQLRIKSGRLQLQMPTTRPQANSDADFAVNRSHVQESFYEHTSQTPLAQGNGMHEVDLDSRNDNDNEDEPVHPGGSFMEPASFYEVKGGGAKKHMKSVFTDLVVLDEADTLAVHILGKELAIKWFWYTCHPICTMLAILVTAVGFLGHILSLVELVPKETSLLMLVPTCTVLVRMWSFYSATMLRLLIPRLTFLLETVWTTVLVGVLTWALQDIRAFGFFAILGFTVTYRLSDARAVFPHSRTRQRAYLSFNQSWSVIFVRICIRILLVCEALVILALPLVFALGLVVDLSYEVVNLSPAANSSLMLYAGGSVSPPQGTMTFIPLNQFASDMLLGWMVAGVSFLMAKSSAAKSTGISSNRGHILLNELVLPVEPVYVD